MITAALSTAVLTWVEMWYIPECEASLFMLTASVSHPCPHLPPPFGAHHVLCMCPHCHHGPAGLRNTLSCSLFPHLIFSWDLELTWGCCQSLQSVLVMGARWAAPGDVRAASSSVPPASIPVGSVMLPEGKAGWKLSGSWQSAERQLCNS